MRREKTHTHDLKSDMYRYVMAYHRLKSHEKHGGNLKMHLGPVVIGRLKGVSSSMWELHGIALCIECNM